MNKFQKAVQKRNAELEKTKDEKIETIEKEEVLQKTLENKDKSEIQKTNSIHNDEQDSVSINVNNLFIPKEKKAKNKTFYLEEDVIMAIEKQAKKQKVSDSKFLNEILKQIFRLNG